MIDRFKRAVSAFRRPQGEVAGLTKKEIKRSLIAKLNRHYRFRIKLEMQKLRQAIEVAENPIVPDRELLYAIYRQVELDDEVITQKRVASVTVQRAPYLVEVNGKEDQKAKDFFEQKWFFDFMEIFIETEFWGHSLLEFSQPNKGDEFSRTFLVPRDHVRPEYGDVIISQGSQVGIPYTDSKTFPFLFEIGKPTNLGLFKVVAEPAIRKLYASVDWSIYSERYGTPLLHIGTSTRDQSEIKKLEDFGANFGINSYVITGENDSVQMESGNKVGGERVFSTRIELSAKQIAKLMNGQSSTSDEKAHVGSAEVHERLLNDFTFSRLRNLCYIVNDRLIPFMIKHGYPLEGAKLVFPELEDQQQGDTTVNSPGEKKKKKAAKKKSEKLNFETKLNLLYDPIELQRLSWKFKGKPKLKQQAKRFFTARTKWEKEYFLQTTNELRDAVKEAIGVDVHKLNDKHPMFAVAQKMRNNIWKVSLAKKESLKKDLTKVLTKSLATFQGKALPILGRYNNTWAETEYNLTLASAQQAEKWNIIESKRKFLPYLKYDAVMDQRVREAHAEMNGITLPIDDPFWDNYYPPNGHNCRCTTLQVAGGEQKPKSLPTKKEVPKIFRNNVGKTGEVFKKDSGYIKRLKMKPSSIQTAIESYLNTINVVEIIKGVKQKLFQ